MLEFHLQEYAALRAEMNAKMEEIGRSSRFLLLALSGLFWWLATQRNAPPDVMLALSAWLPFLVSIFFTWYRSNLSNSVKKLGLYLKKLENEFAKDGLGWERTEIYDGEGRVAKKYLSDRYLLYSSQFVSFVVGAFFFLEKIPEGYLAALKKAAIQ